MATFKILWFEDNLKDFNQIIPKLEDHVRQLGSDLRFESYDHYPTDFDVKMFEGNYNIAFIDLNLNNGQRGTEIIEILREKGVFMEILLYSNNPNELERLTERDNYIEAIFRHATMRGIEDKMKTVIEQVNYKETMVLKRNGFYDNL